MVTRLKVEKAQVEASLREEEAKCGLLLKEVKDSNEVSVLCQAIQVLFRRPASHALYQVHFIRDV